MQRGMSVSVLLRINVCTVVFVMQRESVFKASKISNSYAAFHVHIAQSY